MTKKKAERTDPRETAQEAQTGAGGVSAGGVSEESGAPDVRPDPDLPGAGQAQQGAVGQGVAETGTVARLEAEVGELNDRLLRALAEVENVRRRAERERQEAAEYGGARLAKDLLPVYDNLERALGHADEAARETAGAVIDGVELTRRELLNAFAKNRIEKFAPERGERFDPHFQQAMYEAPVPGARPGTVIEVIQAGFTISDRLLRPALVGVAKAQEAAQEAPQTGKQEAAQADAQEAPQADNQEKAPGGGEGEPGEPPGDRRA